MNHCSQLLETENETMRRIVHAIFNAVTIDAPRERRENHLETDNRLICAVGDHINENLRHQVVGEDVDLLSFQRSAWNGRLVVMARPEITLCAVRDTTLEQIKKKRARRKPHYLQTLLYNFNKELEGMPKQQMIDIGDDGTFNGFTEEEWACDLEKIDAKLPDKVNHYRHFVIVYSASRNELKDIRLVLFDKDFCEVASESLNCLIAPDFGALMAKIEKPKAAAESEEPASKTSLLKVRKGVKMQLRKISEEA